MQSRSALPLARGLPCERFTAALASRTSCITRGRGGWLDLPRGGLSQLFLLGKLAQRLNAVTDSVTRFGEGDKLLLNADRTPNKAGARLTGICGMGTGIKVPVI